MHLFHYELAPDFRRYLEGMNQAADLFISTCDEEGRRAIQRVFAAWDRGTVQIEVFPNRGRDIAPKVVGYKDVYARYDVVLHVHSKKSLHQRSLEPWRAFLLDSLVASPQVVQSVLGLFETYPQVGMIAAPHFEPVCPFINWAGNFGRAAALAERMGFSIGPTLDFPSGSMFWCRGRALRPLLDLGLSFDDFEAERGQLDATLAHAIERLFFLICERAGFSWLRLARPELSPSTPAIVVATRAELDAFVARQGVRLSAEA